MPDLRATLLLFALAVAAACSSSSETITSPSQIRCAVEARTESLTFTPAGGSGTIRVTTARECSWTARSDATWLILSPPMNGQGDGSIGFRVTANDDPAERAAAIGVQDQQVQVAQAGRPCTFELSSVQETFDATGGERTVQVSASSAMCRWTAVSDAPWIAVASGRDGSGNATVVLRIEPLAGPSRIGSVTIAGHLLRVEQGQTAVPSPGPGPGPNCTYSVDPGTYASPAAGGVTAFNIRTAANCAWTSSSSTSWIAVAAGHAGNGPGEVRVAIAANTGPSRSASFNVAGQIITVSQASGCSVSVTPSQVDVAANAGAGTVQVAAGNGCIWSATTATAWIGIPEGGGGTGTGPLRFSVAANKGPARDGAISIGGHIVRVSQASGCTYSISTTSQDVAATGVNGAVSVATAEGCPWTAATSVDWIAVASTTGTGPAQLGFLVAANV